MTLTVSQISPGSAFVGIATRHLNNRKTDEWQRADLDFGAGTDWAVAADAIMQRLQNFPAGFAVEVQLLLEFDHPIGSGFGMPRHFATFAFVQDLDNLN